MLSPASGGEAAGCTQWRWLDCKHSSLLLIQKNATELRGEGKQRSSSTGGEEGQRELKDMSHRVRVQESFWQSRQDLHFTNK